MVTESFGRRGVTRGVRALESERVRERESERGEGSKAEEKKKRVT